MSFFSSFTQLFDSNYQTLSQTGLYKNPSDAKPFLIIPPQTHCVKIAGQWNESWWIVEVRVNTAKEIGFIAAKTLTTYITLNEKEAVSKPVEPSKLTKEMLFAIAPKGKALYIETLVALSKTLFPRFNLNTPQKQAHFIAQICLESAYFTRLEENLNYSALRLLQVFPNRFTKEQAESYAFQPQKIANRVYTNRIGNGVEASGEGYKYRGRGFIQLTGKANYEKIAEMMQLDLIYQPDLLLEPQNALHASLCYWQARGIHKVANSDDVKAVTRLINPALLGLRERQTLFEKLKPKLL